jgi:hypothetical protein
MIGESEGAMTGSLRGAPHVGGRVLAVTQEGVRVEIKTTTR